MSDLSKLLAEISPEQRELLLLRLGKKTAQSETPSASQISSQVFFPLSYAQLRLWFMDQLEPGSPVYNVYFAFRLQGALNVTALEQSFSKILDRHAILRATFTMVDDQPVQVISPEVNISLPLVDLSELSAREIEAEVSRRVIVETRRPFDLTRGPLFRITLLKLAEQEYVLQFTVHHVVSDGWSLEILLSELSSWYQFFTAGGHSPGPLPLSYFDYVHWQKERVEREILSEQLPYWRQRLGGGTPVIDLPLKSTRPTTQTFNGTNEEFSLPAPLTQALKALSQRDGVTLYMTLLAAFQTLLHRYSSQDQIFVGSPTAGRNRIETEALMGMFVNTVVLRSDMSGDPTFRALLARVRKVALGAMAHQELPFEKLVEDLQPERSLSHMPLFNVAFVFQKALQQRLQLPGVTATRLRIEGATAKFDLTLYLTEEVNGLEGVLEYNTDLFAAETIRRMVGHFQTLLEGIIADPDRRLSSLPLLTPAEEQQLLVTWNETSLNYTRQCVHELFEEQAQQRVGAVAVSQNGREWTYGELDARANQLAHYLRKLGVGPEVLVAICMERSLESVLASLGVLKAGGAFVPLDPAHPQERLAFMLSDAGVAVLLSTQSSIERYQLSFDDSRLICLDTGWSEIAKENSENLRSATSLDNLAYVIYTSGSTGRPKGVEIPHAGLLNLCAWHRHVYHVRASDRATHLAAPAFDASVWEVWPYLTAGASLHIPDEETLIYPAKLLEWLAAKAITISFMPTPLGETLLEESLPAQLTLRALLVGGDKLHRPPRQRFPFILANNYGPTENSVVTTWTTVTAETESNVAPPIGRPVANTQVYILDRNLQPVPIGVAGELCISGDSLARGYHDRPALTAEKFIPNHLSKAPAACLYRTGDRVRYLPDGNIEFLGRFDNQIKLRGFRIELGEIEAVLNQHPSVQQAVVMAREDTPGDKRLIAYVVIDPAFAVTTTELRDSMKSRLPDFMLPAAFIMLDQFPLTPNGKVDYRALPPPDQMRPLLESGFVPARSPVEEMLAEIWAEILKVERVGVHDNFFELGGHSLLATQVVSRVRKMFELELPLRVVFEAPTVAEMAEKVEKYHSDDANVPPLVRREPDEEIPLSFAQQRLWFLDQLEPGSALFNVPIAIQLSGRLSVAALQETLAAIVKRHEILRTNYVLAEGQPKQVITQHVTPELRYVDLRSSPEEQREDELRRRLMEQSLQPFSLSDDLLLRATLFQLSETENVLLLATHHIAADGWSMGILFQEIGELYEAFATGKFSPLPDLRIQYGDYAIWQRRWLRGEALEKELSYWRTQLKGAPPVLKLRTGRPRRLARSSQGAHHTVSLSETLTLDIKTLARQEGVTLFMVMLASFQILLSRHAGSEDIVVGTDVANRTHLETEGLIGFFVNLLVLRTDLSGNPTFREVLRRVREVALGAYAHQQMPFEKLVEELQPERSLSRNPLVQVLFVLQNAPMQALELPGLTVKSLRIDTGTSKFDMGLFVRESEQKLVGTWVYNTDLFDAASITNMARQYESLLGNLLAQPDARVSGIEMLSETEKALRDTEKQERQLTRRKNLLSARRKVVDLSKNTSDLPGSQ